MVGALNRQRDQIQTWVKRRAIPMRSAVCCAGSSPPGSSVPGILQAGTLEWVAVPSSGGIFPTQGWNPSL